MGTIAIPGGGPTAGVIAQVDLPVDTLFRYSLTNDNEVVVCGSGEQCDGIVLAAVTAGDLLNRGNGLTQMTKNQGTYDGVVVQDTFTPGQEFMSNGSGQIIQYTNAADNRALGKVLGSVVAGETARIVLYAS